MRVIALKKGYYSHLYRPGDVFELKSDKDFSSSWMKKISDAPKPEKIAVKKPAKKKDEEPLDDGDEFLAALKGERPSDQDIG